MEDDFQDKAYYKKQIICPRTVVSGGRVVAALLRSNAFKALSSFDKSVTREAQVSPY